MVVKLWFVLDEPDVGCDRYNRREKPKKGDEVK